MEINQRQKEAQKEIEFKMRRIKFWETFHLVPSAFDYISEFNPQEVKA
jgi:hypothetical protein